MPFGQRGCSLGSCPEPLKVQVTIRIKDRIVLVKDFIRDIFSYINQIIKWLDCSLDLGFWLRMNVKNILFHKYFFLSALRNRHANYNKED
jgi:hypothetical protein